VNLLAEARRYAVPYRLALTPKVTETAAWTKVAVTVSVTASPSGAKVPGVKVRLAESGTDGESGQVTTGQDGTAAWEFTADTKGITTVRATPAACRLPAEGPQTPRQRGAAHAAGRRHHHRQGPPSRSPPRPVA
jgi:hypothetical protein